MLQYKGKLPEKSGFLDTIIAGKKLDYDNIEWEFVSLKPDAIELALKYYKNNEVVYERKASYKLIMNKATKGVSIMMRNSRLDVTNLLISISNELFANCRERSNPRCILTKVEN